MLDKDSKKRINIDDLDEEIRKIILKELIMVKLQKKLFLVSFISIK
jgi:hypothetical protein